MRTIPAKPTVYGGLQFRSRLEAKWAAFFDTLGWPHEYEPMDLAGWIPDFLLKLDTPVLVEVKPATTIEEMFSYTAKIDAADTSYEVLIVGASPIFDDGCGLPFIGLTREGEHRWGTGWGGAWAFSCDGKHFGFCHEQGSYQCRVCGRYDGDHHLHPLNGPRGDDLEMRWRAAANATQWKSPRNH